jgi:hypothetical protein
MELRILKHGNNSNSFLMMQLVSTISHKLHMAIKQMANQAFSISISHSEALVTHRFD